MLLKTAIILVLILICSAVQTNAQGQYVYLVKAFRAAQGEDAGRGLTGFRVRGLKGIVTALHGVVDADVVKVRSNKEGEIFTEPVSIIKVDIGRDLALLSSKEIDALPDDGLEVAIDVNWNSLIEITVVGHPYAIEELTDRYLVRHPKPTRPLSDLLIGTDALRILNRRQSPAPNQLIVSIQGQIKPGQSGAPVLDASNRVVAVANGGFKENSDITWAIPFQKVTRASAPELDVGWQSALSNSKLQALARFRTDALFAFEQPDTEEIQPFIDVEYMSIGLVLSISAKSKELQEYFRRLNEQFKAQLPRLTKEYKQSQNDTVFRGIGAIWWFTFPKDKIVGRSRQDADHHTVYDKAGFFELGSSFEILPGSSFLPDENTEPLAYALLHTKYTLDISIYNPPVDREQYKSQAKPDLKLSAQVQFMPSNSEGDNTNGNYGLGFDLGNTYAGLHVEVDAAPAQWKKHGNWKTKEWLERALPGAQILIQLRPQQQDNHSQVLAQFNANVTLEVFRVSASQRRALLPRKEFVVFEDRGTLVYEYLVPYNVNEDRYWKVNPMLP